MDPSSYFFSISRRRPVAAIMSASTKCTWHTCFISDPVIGQTGKIGLVLARDFRLRWSAFQIAGLPAAGMVSRTIERIRLWWFGRLRLHYPHTTHGPTSTSRVHRPMNNSNSPVDRRSLPSPDSSLCSPSHGRSQQAWSPASAGCSAARAGRMRSVDFGSRPLSPGCSLIAVWIFPLVNFFRSRMMSDME